MEGRRLPCPPVRSRFRVCAGAVPPGDIQDVFRSRQARLYALHKLLHAHRFRLPRPTLTRSASSPASVLRQAQNQAQAHQRLSAHQIYTSAKQAQAPWTRNPNNGAEAEQHNAKSFAPLPADIILPFASRASARYPNSFYKGANAKLLALLSHVFPPTSDRSLSISDVGPSSSSSPLLSKLPEDWSFSDLRYWLFEVDRKDVGDALWVRTLRRAVLMHSEVLWVRVRAVLGAPFDLDAVVRLPSASQTIQGGEQLPLSLTLIYPSPKTVGDALHGIAKHQNVCEDASKDQGDDRDIIAGLRLSTSRTYPSLSLFIPSGAKRSSSPTRSPRLPFRSVRQNTVSSPLAVAPYGQFVNDARPAPNQPQSSGKLLGKKAKAHLLFPDSFSDLSSRLGASDST